MKPAGTADVIDGNHVVHRADGTASTEDVADIGYGQQFAGWYDRLFPSNASVDVEVERLVSFHPDPGSGTVEFGVGNGRLALPLSRRVGAVTGIDSSPEMLGVLRGNLRPDTPVEPVHADIRTYTADRTAGLVYCVCATLSMLLTPEDQQLAVRRAADLLAPGGRLVVETHNRSAIVGLHEGHRRTSFFTPYPEAGTGLQSHSVLDPDTSLWHLSHIWYEADGSTQVGTEVSRLTAPEEMDAYARAAGLEPEGLFGDWHPDAKPHHALSPLSICTYVKPRDQAPPPPADHRAIPGTPADTYI